MADSILWTALAGVQTAIDTGLNSLANNASVASSAIDNSSARHRFALCELVVTYGTNPTAGSSCGLYVLPSVDGTNYPDFTSGSEPDNALVALFPLLVNTSAQRIVIPRIVVPPGLFKLGLKNGAGQTMAASGNTLKYNLFSEEV